MSMTLELCQSKLQTSPSELFRPISKIDVSRFKQATFEYLYWLHWVPVTDALVVFLHLQGIMDISAILRPHGPKETCVDCGLPVRLPFLFCVHSSDLSHKLIMSLTDTVLRGWLVWWSSQSYFEWWSNWFRPFLKIWSLSNPCSTQLKKRVCCSG